MKIPLNKIINGIECPYCGAQEVMFFSFDNDDGAFPIRCFHCEECDRVFSAEGWIREHIRHQLSPLLVDTDEQHPKMLSWHVLVGERDACGLSTLELPRVTGAFHDPEARIWFTLEGCDEPMNFDNLETGDLFNLLEEFRK